MIDQTRSLAAHNRDLPNARTQPTGGGQLIAITRLERFIVAHGLLPARVGRACGVCRTRLQSWRIGKAWPMLSSIRKLVRGMRLVTNDPTVTANDLFPLDDDE
jgi:hypothetical protein